MTHYLLRCTEAVKETLHAIVHLPVAQPEVFLIILVDETVPPEGIHLSSKASTQLLNECTLPLALPFSSPSFFHTISLSPEFTSA
jgi:hypothetical protein